MCIDNMKITREHLRRIIKEELLREYNQVALPAGALAIIANVPKPFRPIAGLYLGLSWEVIQRIEQSTLGKSLMSRFGIQKGNLLSAIQSGQRNAYGVLFLLWVAGEIGYNIGKDLVDAYPELGAIASGESIDIDLDNIDWDDFKENALPYAAEIASILVPQIAVAPGQALAAGGDIVRQVTTPTASGKLIDPDPRDIDYKYAWDKWSKFVTDPFK
tara:strand:+ start:1791 stop:2438 length:648 start_codon:yes stop_codon:yes gene_type:complete